MTSLLAAQALKVYSRKQLAQWVSKEGGAECGKYADLRTGVFFLKMLKAKFPQDFQISSASNKYKQKPISDYDFAFNLNLMKKILNKHQLKLNLNINTILQTKNCFQFASWFKNLIQGNVTVPLSVHSGGSNSGKGSDYFAATQGTRTRRVTANQRDSSRKSSKKNLLHDGKQKFSATHGSGSSGTDGFFHNNRKSFSKIDPSESSETNKANHHNQLRLQPNHPHQKTLSVARSPTRSPSITKSQTPCYVSQRKITTTGRNLVEINNSGGNGGNGGKGNIVNNGNNGNKKASEDNNLLLHRVGSGKEFQFFIKDYTTDDGRDFRIQRQKQKQLSQYQSAFQQDLNFLSDFDGTDQTNELMYQVALEQSIQSLKVILSNIQEKATSLEKDNSKSGTNSNEGNKATYSVEEYLQVLQKAITEKSLTSATASIPLQNNYRK